MTAPSPSTSPLTHFDAHGQAHMVDVGGKENTHRVARAEGRFKKSIVPVKDIEAMKKEFSDADGDWQMIYYSEAVHSFTQPMAGNDNSRGAAYQERADKRSWQAMKSFFSELFPTH